MSNIEASLLENERTSYEGREFRIGREDQLQPSDKF